MRSWTDRDGEKCNWDPTTSQNNKHQKATDRQRGDGQWVFVCVCVCACVCVSLWLTSTISVQAWKTSCCFWGSMTATWTKALGFLSLPEAARSLQALQRKRGRKGEPRGRRERRSREEEEEESDRWEDNPLWCMHKREESHKVLSQMTKNDGITVDKHNKKEGQQ